LCIWYAIVIKIIHIIEFYFATRSHIKIHYSTSASILKGLSAKTFVFFANCNSPFIHLNRCAF
jgi:hypothetical protein